MDGTQFPCFRHRFEDFEKIAVPFGAGSLEFPFPSRMGPEEIRLESRHAPLRKFGNMFRAVSRRPVKAEIHRRTLRGAAAPVFQNIHGVLGRARYGHLQYGGNPSGGGGSRFCGKIAPLPPARIPYVDMGVHSAGEKSGAVQIYFLFARRRKAHPPMAVIFPPEMATPPSKKPPGV